VLRFGPPQGRGGSGHGRGRRSFARGEYVPFPYYYAYGYYPYGGPDEAAVPPSQPPARVVVVHSAAPPAPPAPPVKSLLLEDHGGQWVRVATGNQVPAGPLSTQPESSGTPRPPAGTASRNRATRPPVTLPDTILVFRDGHKEETTKYVIRGAFIYASADYWSTGSWTKKIPISELNVPATLKLNRERGVKFSLPSGPDEVMVGF